jgi:hypothetical protein
VTVVVGVTVVVTVCVGRGELPAEAETDTEPLTDTDGEKLGMVGVDDDELHAASATGASRVSAPQNSAVSFTPSVVPGTFMDPPHAPGR